MWSCVVRGQICHLATRSQSTLCVGLAPGKIEVKQQAINLQQQQHSACAHLASWPPVAAAFVLGAHASKPEPPRRAPPTASQEREGPSIK